MRKVILSLVLVVALVPPLRPSASAPAPVYVTLWFDTEDYLLPQDDHATKRLAELLTRLGVRATFKVVGEKARVQSAAHHRGLPGSFFPKDFTRHA